MASHLPPDSALDHLRRLEALDELLPTLAEALDIRDVFAKVSKIAQRVLPHDALSIAEATADGERVRIHASHGLGNLPEPFDIPIPDPTLMSLSWEYRIIDDVRQRPEYAQGPGMAAGMRSMLFVPIRFEGRHFGGLNFYSKTPGRYVREDVLIARRITPITSPSHFPTSGSLTSEATRGAARTHDQPRAARRAPRHTERLGRLARRLRTHFGHRAKSPARTTEAAQIANDANQLLAFYHLLPAPDGFVPRRLFAQGIAEAGRGDWTIADDGALYTLPIGSRAIKVERISE